MFDGILDPRRRHQHRGEIAFDRARHGQIALAVRWSSDATAGRHQQRAARLEGGQTRRARWGRVQLIPRTLDDTSRLMRRGPSTANMHARPTPASVVRASSSKWRHGASTTCSRRAMATSSGLGSSTSSPGSQLLSFRSSKSSHLRSEVAQSAARPWLVATGRRG